MRKSLLILAAALMGLAPTSACVAHRVVYYGGPSHAGYYSANPNAGEVRLDTRVENAGVFINGDYVGTTHQNRSMRLRPGSYTIEIRGAGRARYAERIYVMAGRTSHIHPGF